MKALLRAAVKSSAGTLVTLLSSALAVKIIAVFAGPAGVGLFSILRQTQQTASIVGAMGGQAAIVQGLSGKTGVERDVHSALILRTVMIATILVCVSIILVAPWAAPLILVDLPNGANVIRLIAAPTMLGSAVLFLSGVINSHRAVGVLALVQIASGLSLALCAYFASVNPSGVGFVGLLAASGLAGVAAAVYFCHKNDWLGMLRTTWWQAGAKGQSAVFLKVGAATLMTGLMSTGAVLTVRALVSRYQGYAGAGIFDAAWTLSMTYVMLILTSFSAYYLPTLATLNGKKAQRNNLIQQYFRFATFASIPLVAFVMVLKPWVVQLLYSKEFVPAIHMMRWMLLGDFFKISSWVMAMPMLAYADMKPYVISELLWNAGFVLLAAWALAAGAKIENIGIIFMILYLLYFLYTYFYCVRKFDLRLGQTIVAVWLSGFVCLFLLSFLTASFTF